MITGKLADWLIIPATAFTGVSLCLHEHWLARGGMAIVLLCVIAKWRER